jgi:hypothetical protein
VEIHGSGVGDGSATFKWSRENGSVVAKWLGQNEDGDQLTVSSTGRDQVLGFKAGDWIELTDDTRELCGRPGEMVMISAVEGNTLTIDTSGIEIEDFPTNPKVRRWDSEGLVDVEVPATNGGWLPLENGVEIKFESDGRYRAGDYWLIPARTSLGDVIWPKSENVDSPQPLFRSPHGIDHHYCSLALIDFDDMDDAKALADCRPTFPQETEIISLYYVSGTGQEIKPDASPLDLPDPLIVGVSQGKLPMANRKVKFEIIEGGNGQLDGAASPVTVLTDADGLAECVWTLDPDHLTYPVQQVRATLRDDEDEIVHLPIYFHARFNTAEQVYYDPAECSTLDGITNVQDAIDELCKNIGGGCTIPVQPGTDLYKELSELPAGGDCCLCLLPGVHEIAADIISDPLMSVKLVGCGRTSIVSLTGGANLSLTAQQLRLQDINFQFTGSPPKQETMTLAGEAIISGCIFERSSGDINSPPLLLVRPGGTALWVNTLRFKDNRMAARVPVDTLLGFLAPPETLGLPEISEALARLADKDQTEDKPGYVAELNATVSLIEGLSFEDRYNWYKARPKTEINQSFSGWRRIILLRFYELLAPDTINTPALRGGLDEVFTEFTYWDALTLDPRVWGWIEDNAIEGNVTLLNEADPRPLVWTSEYDDVCKQGLEGYAGHDWLSLGEETLSLEGNDLAAVRSSAYEFMKRPHGGDTVIDTLLMGTLPCEWGDEPPTTPGYKSLSVRNNLFHSRGNSFICGSLRMSDNEFPVGLDLDQVVAYVLGYYGTFTGNMAPQMSNLVVRATIEKLLRDEKQAGNLLAIR